MKSNSVILKEGKERSILRGHPWIFSGAIDFLPSCEPGDILPIYSQQGEFLAQGYFHPENSLSGRILSFSKENVRISLENSLLKALSLRTQLFKSEETNAFRLINGEGDGIPGLIVDYYNGYLVLQANSWGIEKLKHFFVETLMRLVKPKAIYEKSSSHSRREEGLPDSEGFLSGSASDEIEILENRCRFLVSLTKGQKTGFFLDQREMRRLIREMASRKKVLNCFSYTGGFSISALKGGACRVDSVDSSKDACQLAEKNYALNGYSSQEHPIFSEDAFDFIRQQNLKEYDFVILDPPAFAKKRRDIEAAAKGYYQLNRSVLEKMPPKSFLLTASCSYYMDETRFQNILFQSALAAKRDVQILSRHIQAKDHPVCIYHPEGTYLKSFLLFVH